MFIKLLNSVFNKNSENKVYAHCDGPCGVYDPASARVAAEAVLSMTKKLIALTPPSSTNTEEWAAYSNTFSRYVAVKEEQAKETKKEILILWTDYFKPVHLDTYPDLHETIWKAAKLCSACKVNIDQSQAEELMNYVEKIHNIFWESKGRSDVFTKAS
ncbi:MAG: superoxide dismutase, Ni [Prochlorococcus sp. SP3034]|nr:superoxide dismutase, Ni [Prochlorococcus sp. SP3034]|tara:strand:- start:929 stop:1402 length:474 start_codon:yes stop_codon:yes gene_type:complete